MLSTLTHGLMLTDLVDGGGDVGICVHVVEKKS